MQTNAVSAEFGRLGGGVLNLITKSGSNTMRATAWEFARNAKMDATNFFTNRAGGRKGDFKRNQFGGNFGGPLSEGQDVLLRELRGPARRRTPRSRPSRCRCPSGVTAISRTSATRPGSSITIYDPATTRPDPDNAGQFIRDPFPGNRIPAERISAMARAMMGYWPLPNATPTNAVHADQQLLEIGRPAEQRRPRRLARRSRLQQPVAHVRPLLVLEREQPAVQQLRQPRLLVGRRRPDVHRRRTACRSITTTRSGRPGC